MRNETIHGSRTRCHAAAATDRGGGSPRRPRERISQEDGVGMEVKPGYKQTEVGVIPEEWDCAAIGGVTDICVGRDLHEEIFSTADDSTYRFPVYSNTVANQGLYGFYSIPEYEGDSLTVVGRGVGLGTAFARKGGYGAIGRLLVLLPNKHRADARFLATFINQKVSIFVETGGIPQLTGIQFSKYKVALPSISEQCAIAEALSDMDVLLGALDRLIAKKRDLKQAAMQQLLTGQTRLPAFHGEWEVKTLYDLADRKKELFDDGDWIEAEFLTESGIRLVQTGNIGEGQFTDKESKKYISDSSFKKLGCKELQIGDILICRLAEPAGRACILPNIGEERVITAVDVSIFRPAMSIADRRFLVNVFNTRHWFEAVSERCGGSTRTRIARGQLGKMEIKLPPLPEQTAIAEVLTDMDAELVALEQCREKTLALKHGMMQELLTGRTRLV